LKLFVEVMGPYGTSLAKTDDFSHILAIGAGTGKTMMHASR
jgi:NAD(P)H-flavin reductase